MSSVTDEAPCTAKPYRPVVAWHVRPRTRHARASEPDGEPLLQEMLERLARAARKRAIVAMTRRRRKERRAAKGQCRR